MFHTRNYTCHCGGCVLLCWDAQRQTHTVTCLNLAGSPCKADPSAHFFQWCLENSLHKWPLHRGFPNTIGLLFTPTHNKIQIYCVDFPRPRTSTFATSTAFVVPSLPLHLCPSLTSPPSFYFSHFCTPVKCFVCCDFPCGYLSGDSMPHSGTGPQFPRQLYNCFGRVPNATGYRGIIDVKRNMYEMRRCGGVHMVLHTASCKAI